MSTPKQVNIDELSLVELKALAYDLGALVQHYSNQLQVANKKIEERAKEKLAAQQDIVVAEDATPIKQVGKAAVRNK